MRTRSSKESSPTPLYYNPITSQKSTLHNSKQPRPRWHPRIHLQKLIGILRLISRLSMAGQSRKWVILVATIWLQAFTGTNFDFSAYSTEMKAVLGITQVQLNYLAVASDLGKAFGWSSGLALMYLPLWVVMFIAAFMGLFGYGLQWLVLRGIFSPPYFVVRHSFSIFFSTNVAS